MSVLPLLILLGHVAVYISDAEVPLTVAVVQFTPGGTQAEVDLRNVGSQAVVAWRLEVNQQYADGSTNRFGLTVDAYEDKAGLLSQDQQGHRLLLPGGVQSMPVALMPNRQTGLGPSAVTIVPVDALLDDNSVVGSNLFVHAIRDARKRDARGFAEVLRVLLEARARQAEPAAAIRAATGVLAAPAAESHFSRTQVRGMLRAVEARAARGLEDATIGLANVIEQTRRRAMAAEQAAASLALARPE
jgi:hypothetical protein